MTNILLWYIGLGLIGAAGARIILFKILPERKTDSGLFILSLAWMTPITLLLVMTFILLPFESTAAIQAVFRNAEDPSPRSVIAKRVISVAITLSLFAVYISRVIAGIK